LIGDDEMIADKSKVTIKVNCNKLKKGVSKATFILLMFSLSLKKASMRNNKRRMEGKPMIRKQAYIKAWKNKKTEINKIQ